MSELEEVSFWPGKSSYGSWGEGSSDGSYSRVGGPTHSPTVSCQRRTVLIVAAVVAVVFIIAVSIPAGMLQHYKNVESASSGDGSSQVDPLTPAPTPAATNSTTATSPGPPATTTAPLQPNTTMPPGPVTTVQPDFPVWKSYRLPTRVMPRIYSVSIDLNMTGEETSRNATISYTGAVIIVLDVQEETDLIVLHARDMSLTDVKVAKCAVNTTYCYDYKNVKSFKMTEDELEHVEVALEQKYPVNSTLNLMINFTSVLSDSLHGFYKSSYSVDNKDRVIATTQFESVFARKAFPCFDEPSFKAQFALNITKPKQWTSLFNTPLNSSNDAADQKSTDYYSLSPKMSSYLVAFVVCDFDHTNTATINSSLSNKPIEINVYGQNSQIDQLYYAAEVAATVIKTYEDFFQIAYPLPKLDIVAIPDFAAGAMENWGLITFRESSLLYDKKSSSSSHKQYVTYVIAHELAHQWFGNLVTMEWWNELWLNEGFATFVGKLIGTKSVNKDADDAWPIDEDFRADMADSLELDGLMSSHPLSQRVEDVNSVDEIEAMFDSITYTKGSGVLNMLYTFVTPNVTTTALRNYLNEFKYGNAKASDLWRAFDKAYLDKNPGKNKTAITQMMKSWTDTLGHPFITANIGVDAVSINQSQFFLCSTCNRTGINGQWVVPISYNTYGTSDETDQRYTLKDVNGSIAVRGADWVLLNQGWTGYYHVYTDFDKLKLSKMSDIDIGNAVEDLLQLFRGGHVSSEVFVRFLNSVATSDSADYLSWTMLLKCMDYLLSIYDHQYYKYEQVSTQVYQWLNVSDMNLAYDAVDGMAVKYRKLLGTKLGMAITIDHNLVINDIPYMTNLTDLWLESVHNDDSSKTDGVIHKDIARQIWRCGFKSHESGSLWANLWLNYQGSNIPSQQSDYRVVLASGNDNALLNHYLDYALDSEKTKSGDTVTIISLVASNRRSRYDTWDFVKTNWDTLISRYQNQGFTMKTLIESTTIYFSDETKLADMQQFFSTHELGAGEWASKQSLEIVQANIYMMQELSRSLITNILELEPK